MRKFYPLHSFYVGKCGRQSGPSRWSIEEKLLSVKQAETLSRHRDRLEQEATFLILKGLSHTQNRSEPVRESCLVRQVIAKAWAWRRKAVVSFAFVVHHPSGPRACRPQRGEPRWMTADEGRRVNSFLQHVAKRSHNISWLKLRCVAPLLAISGSKCRSFFLTFIREDA